MNDERRVLELLRALDATATPVATPRDLDPVWQTITTRIERGEGPQIPDVVLDLEHEPRKETTMQTVDTRNEQQQVERTRIRPALVVAAMFVLIATATAVVMLARQGTSPDVVVDSSGVPNLIRTSLAALEAGDYEAWRQVRSEDAVLSDGYPVVEDSPLGRVIARQAELDLRISIGGCEETTAAADAGTRTFDCQVEGSNAIMRAAGLTNASEWTFVIEDGLISQSPPPFFDDTTEAAQAVNDLVTYLREVDRAGLDRVCNSGDLNLFDARIGAECTRFINDHLDGFQAHRSGGS